MDAFSRRNGPAHWITIICASLTWVWLPAVAATESRFTILYHEPLVLQNVDLEDPEQATQNTLEILRFDAFGRRFDIQLEPSARQKERDQNTDPELFTGHVAGATKSWVRLMRQGSRLSGVIRDDFDTYFIEPRSNISEALGNDYPPTDSVNVIYRLADTLVASGLLSCETHPSNDVINGQVAFTKLTNELTAADTETAAARTPTARIGVVADLDFFARFGSNSGSEIDSIFNVVDGIFSEQVGVEIDVAETLIISSENQNPFSATTTGAELLDELGNWRRFNQTDLGLTHMVTDRELIGEDPTVIISGLSFFGVPGRAGVCYAQSGAGLTVWSGSLTALIIAHEIAHNFGAPHDGEPSDLPLSMNPCESTPAPGFIMSPSLKPPFPDEFSPCSLQEMQKVIANASCLTESTSSTPVTTQSGSTGGGGGALHWLSLILLFAIAIVRRVP